MKKRTKKWINKKRATTFELVTRSESEQVPEGEDPYHVLVPINKNLPSTTIEEGQFDNDTEEENEVIEKISNLSYNEKDYDYSRHYRTIGRPGGVFITPAGRVVPSEEAPQDAQESPPVLGSDAGIDPDLKEALENYDQDKYEELPDNFMQIAQQDLDEAGNIDFGSYGALDDIEDDEAPKKPAINNNNKKMKRPPVDEDIENFEDDDFDEDDGIIENIPRKRTLVDDQFDIAMKKFNDDIEEMYEETDKENDEDSKIEMNDKSSIAPSDLSEKPMASTKIFDTIFDQFLKSNNNTNQNDKKDLEELEDEKPQNSSEMINPIAMKYAYIADSESDDFDEVTVKEKKPEWDCESIISTYSNLENHPSLIIEPDNKIKLNKKGFPKITKEPSESTSEDVETEKQISITRPKLETPEEKKQRKKLFKTEKKNQKRNKERNEISLQI